MLEITEKDKDKNPKILSLPNNENFNPPLITFPTHEDFDSMPPKQSILRALFDQALDHINMLATHPECFICYSWGSLENARMIRQIAQDLKRAGIRIFLDTWEIKVGDSISEYMGKIRTCQYVLLMGSPELYKKFQEPGHSINQELDLITTKYKYNRQSVLPFLVAGEPTQAFPYTIGGGEDLAYIDFRKNIHYYDRLLDVLLKLANSSPRHIEIQALCEDFKKQKEFITSDKYPLEKLKNFQQEFLNKKANSDQNLEKKIDQILSSFQKDKTQVSQSEHALLIDLKPSLESFVGRSKQLKALTKELIPTANWNVEQAIRLIILTGPGGIGKSELACYFANSHTHDFSFICWIDNSTVEMRLYSYRKLAETLGIHVENKLTPEKVFSLINHHLEKHSFNKPWLLILDNVTKPVSLPQRGGVILATSIRRDFWVTEEKCLEVPCFDQPEALKFVMEKTHQTDQASMKLLIEKLDYFPLALGQATALIFNRIPISEYLKRLQDDLNLILVQQEGTSRHSTNLEKTWSLTLKELKEHHPIAYEAINLRVHFSFVKIPESWIHSWLKDEKRLKGAELYLKSWEIFRVLQSYSLITLDPSTHTFSMHRLMHQVIYLMQKDDGLELYNRAFARLEKEWQKINKNIAQSLQGVEIWISHADWVIQSHFFESIDKEKKISIYLNLGKFKRCLSDYKGALAIFYQCLEELQKLNKSRSRLKLTECLMNISDLIGILGQDKEALKLSRGLAKFKQREAIPKMP